MKCLKVYALIYTTVYKMRPSQSKVTTIPNGPIKPLLAPPSQKIVDEYYMNYIETVLNSASNYRHDDLFD